MADCTFKPVINRRSDRLMSDRSTVLRVHAFLMSRRSVSSPCVGGRQPAAKAGRV